MKNRIIKLWCMLAVLACLVSCGAGPHVFDKSDALAAQVKAGAEMLAGNPTPSQADFDRQRNLEQAYMSQLQLDYHNAASGTDWWGLAGLLAGAATGSTAVTVPLVNWLRNRTSQARTAKDLQSLGMPVVPLVTSLNPAP